MPFCMACNAVEIATNTPRPTTVIIRPLGPTPVSMGNARNRTIDGNGASKGSIRRAICPLGAAVNPFQIPELTPRKAGQMEAARSGWDRVAAIFVSVSVMAISAVALVDWTECPPEAVGVDNGSLAR